MLDIIVIRLQLYRTHALVSGEGDLVCHRGCSGTVGNMSYYYTDFSDSEDWTTEERMLQE